MTANDMTRENAIERYSKIVGSHAPNGSAAQRIAVQRLAATCTRPRNALVSAILPEFHNANLLAGPPATAGWAAVGASSKNVAAKLGLAFQA
jgi:hypothetical protein